MLYNHTFCPLCLYLFIGKNLQGMNHESMCGQNNRSDIRTNRFIKHIPGIIGSARSVLKSPGALVFFLDDREWKSLMAPPLNENSCSFSFKPQMRREFKEFPAAPNHLHSTNTNTNANTITYAVLDLMVKCKENSKNSLPPLIPNSTIVLNAFCIFPPTCRDL